MELVKLQFAFPPYSGLHPFPSVALNSFLIWDKHVNDEEMVKGLTASRTSCGFYLQLRSDECKLSAAHWTLVGFTKGEPCCDGWHFALARGSVEAQ